MSKHIVSAAGGAMPAEGQPADHPDAALFAMAEECSAAASECEKAIDHLNLVEAEYKPVPAPDAIMKTKRDAELGLYLGSGDWSYGESEIAAIRVLCRTIGHSGHPTPQSCEAYKRSKEILEAWTAWREAFTREEERSGIAAANRAYDVAADRFDEIAERLARTPAASIEGVLAKTRATLHVFIDDLALARKIWDDLHIHGHEHDAIATSLARDLIRLVKSEGAAQ
jgi:hypothetical protein